MARPQVADGGDGLQIWRAPANVLNKQHGQPTGGGPTAWGLGVGEGRKISRVLVGKP
jgi:hypothetical protein